MAREAFRSLATALLVATFLSTVFSFVPPCPKRPAQSPRTWNYNSQVSWGSQWTGWSWCSSGLLQSPIDITPPALRNGWTDKQVNIRYPGQIASFLFNTGNYFIGSSNSPIHTVSYNGMNYVLKEFIFHSPSEHLWLGKRFDLELQLVHSPASKGDAPLTVSIFFQRSADGLTTNKFLEQLIHDLPQFSDCSCGNGRFESHTIYESITKTVGVTEECDNDGRNSNASLPNGQPNCCRPNCKKATCGDGIVDYGENCDNGALNANKTGALCRVNCCNATCGDGILDPALGEECDDGNRQNLDGCSSICKRECGDGELNLAFGLEQCDNGTANNNSLPDTCRTNCRLPACGDGTQDSGEGCDTLPAGVNPSQCRGSCVAPVCGDAITDENEDCDDGVDNGPTKACNTNCKTNCGDGVIQDGEECDNGAGGNSNKPDASCRSNCMKRRCGDGIVDISAGEQCDSVYEHGLIDAVVGGWWCDNTCQQQCGSGLCPPPIGPATQNPDKACDHGCYNADVPNRCRTNCAKPKCGDGIVDHGETCDNGDANSNSVKDGCRMNCVLAHCGDGVVDTNETCDDGNFVAGDGCDPTCRKECGNGNLEASAGEECDYGAMNADAADKCRLNCKLPACGDGIVDSLEECDDGAKNSDTAPNACGTDCTKPFCGDGIIDPAYGEKCDNGAANSDTAPFGCSLFCIPNYCRQRATLLSLSDALPQNKTGFYYMGSQTHPPCNPNRWLVFSEVQEFSEFQYAAFTNEKYGLPNRARNVQSGSLINIQRLAVPPTPMCGNGIQEAGEECDNGWFNNADNEANRCRTNCKKPTCGDGVTDRGEECDDASHNGVLHHRCTDKCKLKPRLINPFQAVPWSCANSCKWSMLSPLHAACAGERPDARQSPINIDTAQVKGLNPRFSLPPFAYGASEIKFVNTGRTLALLPTGTHTFAGANLARIEFHAPSEHTVNGVHADLEAQLLHSTPDGNWVGVALLYNVGATPSAFLSQFEFYVPKFSDCALNNGIIEPGEECDDGPHNSDSRPGHCRRNGRKPGCGDGVVDRGEQCDNGAANKNAADSCKTSCTLPYCGDGFVDANEQCDPLVKNGPPCDAWCNLLCGNGLIDGAEECDDGAANSDTAVGACRTNCKNATCGDGVLDAAEACDNGAANGDFSSGCRKGCVLPKCGDGVTDYAFGETCDDGSSNGKTTSICDADCHLVCGNGKVDAANGEECDHGDMNGNWDGACRTTCRTPKCGDGIVDESLGEECDDGLNTGKGPCSATCKNLCGNSAIDLIAGEECDWGTNNDDTLPNTCRTTCKKPTCGDGVQDAGEQCDFGTQNGNKKGSPCRANCKLPALGDGVVDAEEQCDDGNTNNNDGCSATGKWECGNGRRDGAREECDNGADNSNAPNSCRAQGTKVGGVEIGCRLPFCGDGIVDAGEQCDDGSNNGATPNSCRIGCKLPVCGDGIIDDLFGERCDNGAGNGDFAVDGCSSTCSPNSCRSCSAPAGRMFGFAGAFWDSPVATYAGSLTSPPCAEKVQWYVLTKPATITARQLALFRTGGCAREVQPLNGRVVAHTDAAGSLCGNCKVEPGEECDTGDNNDDAPNKCKKNCKKPRCGDGFLDAGEECDQGPNNTPDGTCDLRCKWVRSCPAVCTGGKCPNCAIPPPGNAPTCGNRVTNNSGTIINVNFARLLQGAGCTGPNCNF